MENEKLQYQVDTQGKEIAVLKSDIKNMSNTLTQLLIDVKVMNENIKNVASKQDSYNGTNVLKNMSKEQLIQVRNILADLSKAVTNTDKLFKNDKFERMSKLRDKVFEYLDKVGVKANLSKGQKAWANPG